jgi:signal recognition particle subunit SRP54
MFNTLSEHFVNSLDQIRSKKLNEKNMKSTLKDIRKALIDADVALPVIKNFIKGVKNNATGQDIIKKAGSSHTLIKIVNDELVKILGENTAPLNLKTAPPAVFLMAGLQGSGKTTTVAKLALLLKQTMKKSVLITSADVYRPAAIEQLKTLSEQVEVDLFPSTTKQKPTDIAKGAIQEAINKSHDIVIIDTAGRNHIDAKLMDEIKQLSKVAKPIETLLVVDSMTGQDAANIAKEFNNALEITGIVLTKTDGDARGGAALSMSMITEKPIKFIGTGEKIDALETFHPDRIASRILGKGDIVSLVEEAERKIDQKEAEKLSKKVKKGLGFDLNDFLSQLQQMKKMGGIEEIMKKIPGGANLPNSAQIMDDSSLKQFEAIINSMTKKEKKYPSLINPSRKKRIAQGSGTSPSDVSSMLKKYEKMKKTMRQMKGNKLAKRLNRMKGQIPPELMDQFPPDS